MYSRAEPSGIPSRDMHAFHGPHITEDDFRIVWATGEPLCVDGLLGRFKIPWEPSYFIEEFGNQHCLIVDCRSETQTPSTVGEFFGQFGDPGRGSKVEKLKVMTRSSLRYTKADILCNRTGPQRRISSPCSPNSSKTSVTLFPCLTTQDETGS